jgi:enoyl-CoA hydratase
MPWLLGARKSKELLYTGEDRISAEQALAMGLVNRVVPRDELDDATIELANEIAKNDPVAIAMTKKSINRMWELSGFREAIASNVEMDSIIEAAEVPERIEFRKITQEQGLKAAIAWRDARFREQNA